MAAAASLPAGAAELATGAEVASVDVHGFVSQGAIKSTSNNYLVNSVRGSLDFTEAGLNFTTTPLERLRIGYQLFARRLGTTGNFNAKTDWFYLDYRWRDWLGIRAGRVKLPFGLYNDINDVDAARAPILLPQSVYPITSRDFLLAQSGFEVYGYLNLGLAGAFDYRLYAGAVQIDVPSQVGSPLQIASIETPYVIGGRALWELPIEGLRVGATLQALRLDLSLVDPMPAMANPRAAQTFGYSIPAVLWLASVEYNAHDVLLAAEYGRWHTSANSDKPMVVPSSPSISSERMYAMAAYHVTRWVQPSVYYSLFFPNADRHDGPGANQHDVAATLRFDINSNWLIKLETHVMHGTAALTSALNDGKPPSSLPNDWLVFLLKTTAFF